MVTPLAVRCGPETLSRVEFFYSSKTTQFQPTDFWVVNFWHQNCIISVRRSRLTLLMITGSKTMKATGLALISALLLTAVGSARADLIENGSFEADIQANGTWAIYSDLTGWAGGEGGIELRNNVVGTAYDGVNYIELDTTRNSVASQIVGTTAVEYVLSFAYSPRINQPESTNGIEVLWNNISQGIFSGSGGSTHNWQVFSLAVVGGSPTSTLMFRAVGTSDSLGGSLDAVSLVRVPEPSTLALFGLGMIGLLVGRRKRAG